MAFCKISVNNNKDNKYCIALGKKTPSYCKTWTRSVYKITTYRVTPDFNKAVYILMQLFFTTKKRGFLIPSHVFFFIIYWSIKKVTFILSSKFIIYFYSVSNDPCAVFLRGVKQIKKYNYLLSLLAFYPLFQILYEKQFS